MRRTVILLVLAGLLPIIVLSASFGAATLIHDRNSLAANVEGRGRYAAALVGPELDSDKRATDTIAQSTAFDRRFDAERFRPFLERLVARERGWRRIRVSDAGGIRTNPGIFARLGSFAANILRFNQIRSVRQDRYAAAPGWYQTLTKLRFSG